MKQRHLILAGGLMVAAWLAFFGNKTPNSEVAEAVAPSTKRTPTTTTDSPNSGHAALATTTDNASESKRGKDKHAPEILALRTRQDLIGGASTGGKDATLFGVQSFVPPPPPPPKPAPPPPPTAPNLPFTYIGKKLEDAVWEVYLTQGEHTIIVREKSMIEQTYRVESIKPPTMTLTYLPLNQMQTLPIGGDE